MAPATVEVVHHAEIHPAVPGDVRVSVSIGPYGELIALWSGAAVPVRVTAHVPDTAMLMELPQLKLSFPTAYPMPGGNLLVVGARARKSQLNGVLLDPDGGVVARAPLGDGIEHVATTRTGDIWVGYFDEGVFGSSELGAAGLVRFDSGLQPVWRFPSHTGIGFISDCYALNVTSHTVWTCYYTDFPVVRIQDDKLTSWHNKVAGVRALITDGYHIGLFGGYHARDQLAVGFLDYNALHIAEHYRLTLPGGTPLPPDAHVIGRGTELHVITTNAWYRLDLTDVITDRRPNR